jgi:hypothetical protein
LHLEAPLRSFCPNFCSLDIASAIMYGRHLEYRISQSLTNLIHSHDPTRATGNESGQCARIRCLREVVCVNEEQTWAKYLSYLVAPLKREWLSVDHYLLTYFAQIVGEPVQQWTGDAMLFEFEKKISKRNEIKVFG